MSVKKILLNFSKNNDLEVALGQFSILSEHSDVKTAVASLGSSASEVEKVMSNADASKAFVLASANASLVREILNEISEAAAESKANKSSPRQSSLFRVLELEAETLALMSLLRRALGGELSGAGAISDSMSAFIASLDLVEQISALILALDTQEPEGLFPEGPSEHLRRLSLSARVNRELGDSGKLPQRAMEHSAAGLGIAG